MTKIAAIDAGSNAVRMTIGSVNADGELKPVDNIRLPIRLGRDVFTGGMLEESTIQRAAEAFEHFRRTAEEFGVVQLKAIATSALREASNTDILIDRVARSSGIELEVISGTEEARLIHRAVAQAVSLKGKRAVLIDIGGGSVEVTISENGNITTTESYRLGTVRLLQNLHGGRDWSLDLLGRKDALAVLVHEYADSARRRIDRQIGPEHVNLCIGTGGTVEELGRLCQRLFSHADPRMLTLSQLEEIASALNALSIKDRIHKLKLGADRADVILPAAIVLQTIAREAHARHIAIPGVGLKDGMLLEMAEALKLGSYPLPREQAWESAVQLGRKYNVDPGHAAFTARLAGELFEQSQALHQLGGQERLMLEVAALLHDIGHFISSSDHDQHGYYLLKANRLIGLTEQEQDIVARLIRYHRQPLPGAADPEFKSLPRRERITITKLSALLRLADAVDVRHANQVTGASLSQKKRSWQLALQGKGDLMLEKWALDQRRMLFEEIFGVPLQITDKS